MRSIVENHVEDFLEILTYEKRFWYDFWRQLHFKPITDNYEKHFTDFGSLLGALSRDELTEFSHDFEAYKEDLRNSIPIFIRSHSKDLQLSKSDFVIFLIAGPGVKDWVVVDGKGEKVIVVDVFSAWRKGKLRKLPELVYQAAVHFRNGEVEGDFYDKDEIFSFLKREIERIPNERLLEDIPPLLDKFVPYYNWTGFYLMGQDGTLHLGPFVGEPTEHVRIPIGRGICGQAAERKVTFIVQDVAQETNYLACSEKTKSEIVVPILRYDGSVFGEIDIDSHYVAPFDERDRDFLEWIARQVTSRVVHWHEYESRIKTAWLDSYVAYILNDLAKRGVEFSVSLFVAAKPGEVPENIYRLWRVARKMPNIKMVGVTIVEHPSEQGALVSSGNVTFTLDCSDLDLPPEKLVLKFLRELPEPLAEVLMTVHCDAVRYAQSFVNTKSIIDYSLKPNSDPKTVLYAFLTGITAGYSGSFNRAMFFSYTNGKFLFNRALGPRTLEEAQRIWEAVDGLELNMDDFIENVAGDYRSSLEIPYEGKEIDPSLVREFLDGGVHVLRAGEFPQLKSELDIVDEFALVAIKFGDKLTGLIIADNSFDGKPISKYQLDVLSELAHLMALVIENRRFLEMLKHRADVDVLTGLRTRRAFEEFIEHPPFERFALLFVDLNNFKEVNDIHGHGKRDEVLRAVGKCINLNIRKTDLAFRYGGDEMVLIFQDVDRLAIEKIVERIHVCFNSATSMTFSTGVAVYPDEGSVVEVLRKADRRCFQSKLSGKIEF